ncbi:MAG: ABC transporter permease [Gammaproteobacteria bacterium]
MQYFSDALAAAIQLIIQFDPEVYAIVWTSLKISLLAAVIASALGVILGIWVSLIDFAGKRLLQHILNALMAMPTVMIGLIFYGLLSRRGPFGEFGLLYTPAAVILGETCLIFPIIMNMAMVAVQTADPRLLPTLKLLGARTDQQLLPVMRELRYPLLHAVITGFGRAIGEVGAAMMLGGNIMDSTRTITTAIALETSKGEFELGLALGLILLTLAFMLNMLLQALKSRS